MLRKVPLARGDKLRKKTCEKKEDQRTLKLDREEKYGGRRPVVIAVIII